MRSVVVYSVLRVLAFVVPFGVLMLFPAFQELPWLAAVFAAVIGLALSMLFLRRPLEAVSAGLSERRRTRRDPRDDATVEDEADDAARADTDRSADAEARADAEEDPTPRPSSGDQPTNAQNSSPA